MSQDELLAGALTRLGALIAEGVTTVEVKSGYGLTIVSERAMLVAARRLADERAIRVVTTFLGAHALPPEFAGDADGYLTLVCDAMLPKLAEEGLVDAVDVFCEGIGFSAEQAERVFKAAAACGLPVKAHAEQLSNLQGAALAARRYNHTTSIVREGGLLLPSEFEEQRYFVALALGTLGTAELSLGALMIDGGPRLVIQTRGTVACILFSDRSGRTLL